MMDQFLSKLLDKYGLARIIIAVLIGFIVLWALAHLAAAPGGNVSVLWGLVQYTKSKSDTSTVTHSTPDAERTKQQQTLSQHQEMSRGPAEIPDDLGVIHGITPKTSDQTLKSLRAKRQLRPLEALESGRSVAETPRGTYFFIFYFALGAARGKMVEELGAQVVSRFTSSNAYFEIHLLKVGSPIILGFTAESDAVRVGSPTPEIRKVSIAPLPWEKMTSLLSLPADRIVTAKTRTLSLSKKESIYILDCEIR
jgi:hypothetical protein